MPQFMDEAFDGSRSAPERSVERPVHEGVRHDATKRRRARLPGRRDFPIHCGLRAGFWRSRSMLAYAEVVKNPIAVFAALDKVTGRISHLEIPINKTVEFGALKVTPRVCDTRPPTERRTPHPSSRSTR